MRREREAAPERFNVYNLVHSWRGRIIEPLSSSDHGQPARRLRRDISAVPLLFACVGSIIGSGWLLGGLNAVQIAGPASLISWGFGALAIALLAMVHAELGGTWPTAGGSAVYPHLAYGGLAGMVSGWGWYLSGVMVAPAEAEAALSYTSGLLHGQFPWLAASVTPDGALTFPTGFTLAAVGIVVFTAINLLGVKWLTTYTNFWVVLWKILVPVLVIALLFAYARHPANLSSHGFMPYGYQSIFIALPSGIIFSYLGFEQAVQLGAETKNPWVQMPLAVIGSLVIGTVIFVLLAATLVLSVDPSDLSKGWAGLQFKDQLGPYAAIANLVGLSWLAGIIYVDAVISPAGTGLVYVGSSGRLGLAAAAAGYAPRALTRLSDRGVPWIAVITGMILGLALLLPFPNWKSIIAIDVGAVVVSYGLQPLASSALRRQSRKKGHKSPLEEGPFPLPGGDAAAFLAFYVANLLLFWTGWDTLWKLMLAMVVGLGAIVAYYLRLPASDRADVQWRAAAWLVPWLGGLTIISLFGTFPIATKAHGLPLGLLPFGWDFVVIGFFSAIIMAVAVSWRLPDVDARDLTASLLNEIRRADTAR
jgi:amino acid transporter